MKYKPGDYFFPGSNQEICWKVEDIVEGEFYLCQMYTRDGRKTLPNHLEPISIGYIDKFCKPAPYGLEYKMKKVLDKL